MIELDYQEIGRNIRRYRLECGLKQKELAEKISMSEQHISHIENGHTQLSLPTLVAISNVLSVDCNTLLGETLTGSQEMILNQELNRLVANMDVKKLRICVELCRLLADYEA